MYTSHMGSNRCALVHTSIGAESSRQRQIRVPLLDEYAHLPKSGGMTESILDYVRLNIPSQPIVSTSPMSESFSVQHYSRTSTF